jgi:Tol biopolymer transport system component
MVLSVLAATAALFGIVAGWWWYSDRLQPPTSRIIAAAPLKFSGTERIVLTAAAASPNGKFLAYADRSGLVVRTISSGEERTLIVPTAEIRSLAWLPDSGSFLAAGTDGVWRVSIGADPARQIARDGGLIAVAPDGRHVALTGTGGASISLMTITGERVRELVGPEAGAGFSRPTWSPDGQRIAFQTNRQGPTGLIGSIETIHIAGGGRSVVIPTFEFRSMVWAPDGRLLIARPRSRETPRADDLWAIDVDLPTGQPRSELVKIWQAPRANILQPHLSFDGTQLVFLGDDIRLTIGIADWDAPRMSLTGLRTMTVRGPFAEIDHNLGSWTAPGDSILFSPFPVGTTGIFRQALNEREPQVFLAPPRTRVSQAVLSPDTTSIFYVAGTGILMRQPASGGSSEPLFTVAGSPWIKCSPPSANVCVVASRQSAPTNQLDLTPFDPVSYKPAGTITMPQTPNEQAWDLSPDGTKVVTLDPSRAAFRLWVVNLRSGTRYASMPQEFPGALGVAWAGDGHGWIVTRSVGPYGSEVLHIDVNHQSRVLWKSDLQALNRPTISPDGRRIAFSSFTTRSTVWALRGF